MLNFRDLSIKSKLKTVILFTNIVILLLASIAFVTNEWFTFRQHLVTDLYTLADLVGKNSIGGLVFDDYDTLTEDLTSLQVNRQIMSAYLYSKDGKKVASYVRDKDANNAMEPADIKNVADNHVFHDTYVEIFKKIFFQDTRHGQLEFLGTVYLQSDLQEIQKFWNGLGYIMTAIFLVSLVLALLLASKLQEFITAPIYSLLDTMHQVTIQKDFSVRTNKPSNDELGYLSDGFNQMLTQIESCNIEITETNQHLSQTLRQLQTTQKQLIESEKMAALGNLVAGVAHEINTPIGVGVTTASGLDILTKQLADLYATGKMKRSDLDEFLKHAREGTTLVLKNLSRAAELIRSFKQVAVDQTGEQQRTFDLKQYLREILLTLHPELKHTPHRVNIVCEENITLTSYPGAFSQILTNLVMNSLIHGFPKTTGGLPQTSEVSKTSEVLTPGQITISVHNDNDKLILRHSDNGKGISKDVIDHIFEPFFTTNRQGGGSGLGLHIVYNLVSRKLNGTIRCESVEGQETSFIIEIPKGEWKMEK